MKMQNNYNSLIASLHESSNRLRSLNIFESLNTKIIVTKASPENRTQGDQVKIIVNVKEKGLWSIKAGTDIKSEKGNKQVGGEVSAIMRSPLGYGEFISNTLNNFFELAFFMIGEMFSASVRTNDNGSREVSFDISSPCTKNSSSADISVKQHQDV